MSLLAPAGLAFGLLALPILLLYMLKLRRREVEVSSTLLWQRLLRDRQANAPWQRIRRNLLLFLQLAVLAGLALALARPAQPVPTVASGPAVIVLDASASMNAADGEPTRFDSARQEAQRIVAQMPPGAPVTLILAGPEPQTLASGGRDDEALRRALESARPSQAPADWPAALALAAGAASQGSGATVVILSDGGLPAEGLPPLPVPVRYVPVGRSAENSAVSALAVRAAGDRAQLFARVTHYGASARQALLSIYADGGLVDARPLSLAPGESRSVVLEDLPLRPAVYEARLADPEGRPLDALPLDDAAYTVFQPPAGGRVLLSGAQNLFLEQLLAAMPNLSAYRNLPGADGQLTLPADPFDVYIFDGALPPELPAGNLLLVNPPDNELFPVTGIFTVTEQARVAASPLTGYLEWDGVHVRAARQAQLPAWATALVSVSPGPLVFAGEQGGRRVAVVTFDLHDSDLPLQVAFPILFDHLLGYLTGSGPAALAGEAGSLRPGESLLLQPLAGAGQAAVTTPSGQVVTLELGESGALFRQTGEPGVYRVAYQGASPQQAAFAVNLFNPLESNIRPAPSIQVGRQDVPVASRDQVGQRELWPWLAALALALLVVEWWVYHRRSAITSALFLRLRPRREG